MEALYLSEFAQVTRLVPGEADDWCASCANDNPRTIVFTSDTDLVLYEYPPECLIIFFKDVSLLPNPEFRAYSPITICKRLKLSSFIPLAYAIVQEPGKSLSENIEDAENCDLNSDAYLDFSKRYTTKIQTPSYVHNRPVVNVALQKLDVRVSEFVHQALGHILVPIIYLPFLLEDPHLAASWNLGEDLRILAYSLLSPNRVAVQEYQRRAQSITVQEHTLYPLEKTQSTAVKLLDNISAWIQWTADVNLPRGLIWPLFGVSLTLAQLQYPPKVSRLAGVINGDFDNTWDFVHLTARVHAVSYSLRLFKQCIEVWLALYETNVSGGLHDIILRLNQALESFPTIADMFTIPGQPKKEVLADDGTLRQALTNMYAGSSIKVPDEHTSKKKRKQERKAREKDEKKNLVREAGAKKPGANVFNVFDVLDRRTLS
ncbi:hypothetical protein K505DRAFT_322608 [Melanomma pulvis-pyrius CBS 109.77]|uniref:Asteroid domain-containing protein n=1 Tax=Melanomma pulvis-pyrius CBS 109.77 TaxID=1314802 RepID=A0A6A6XMQ3_9PLEO|nr:hypothetical protein K505DRAFT_322608 [Melanomma pulvis-pyrius CBS 109.77]